jgi:Protein of unknown function (DUF3025)
MTAATSPAPRNASAPAAPNMPENRMDAGCYDSIRETARRLDFRGEVAPDVDSLNRLLDGTLPPLTTASGKRLRFVGQTSGPASLGYEAQILETGHVPTRPGYLHDSFNALVWMTFPQTKAAINARHVMAQRVAASTPNRSPLQDALTLFDECGVIVVSDRPDLFKLIEDFRWKDLFWQRRAELYSHINFFLFGHGLMEQLLNPYVGLTGKALLMNVSTAWLQAAPDVARRHIDAACRALIASPGTLSQGRDLVPLPVLGIPGWSAENEDAAYYDNVAYFRPGRRGNVKRME